MKKLSILLLLSFILLTASTASGQQKSDSSPTDKGWWIGGQIGYWYDDGENTFTLEPEIGYDFNSRWAAGTSFGVALVDDLTVYAIAPYARWKYCSTNRLTLFLDGGLAVAGGDMTGFKIGLQPGLSIKINNHFRLLTSVGFLGYCNEFYNGGSGDGFGVRLSSSDLKFGFHYTF